MRDLGKVGKFSYFTHPNAVCMSYFQHMKLSLGFSASYLEGSAKAFAHAFFPNAFVTSTTDINEKVGQQLKEAGCRATKN
jgi:hypothetical protein